MQDIEVLIQALTDAGERADLEALAEIDGQVRPAVDALMARVSSGEVPRQEASRLVERLLGLHLEVGMKVAEVRREAAKGLREAREGNRAASGYLDTQKLR